MRGVMWSKVQRYSKTQLLLLFLCGLLGVSSGQQAVDVAISSQWLGSDGLWSPAIISVGSPPQPVNVIPSTSGQETLVIGLGGCDGTTACTSKRGGLFAANESSTWIPSGSSGIKLDAQLQASSPGYFGLDTIAASPSTSAALQSIGIVNDTHFYLGSFGLGIRGTNMNQTPMPSYLYSLGGNTNSSVIPSLSYGYTAGASYRSNGVPASLVLGGYDANRFQPNGVSISLDLYQQPSVAVNGIMVSAGSPPSGGVTANWKGSSSFTLMDPSLADVYTIDSTTPYLWLPPAICAKFEAALGLIYDESVQLYTFSDSHLGQLNALRNSNLTFNFVIADAPRSSNAVTMQIVYAAFDLALTAGYPNLTLNSSSPSRPYFPLRKAANNTQSTIGRAFLQETYLRVDYQRNNFSISQATFDSNARQDTNIINVFSPSSSGSGTSGGPSPAQSSSLSTGVWIGIAVGGTAVIFGAAAFIYLCCLRRRNKPGQIPLHFLDHKSPSDSKVREVFDANPGIISEAGGREIKTRFGDVKDQHPYHAAISPFDLPSSAPIELPAATRSSSVPRSPTRGPRSPTQSPLRSPVWPSTWNPARSSPLNSTPNSRPHSGRTSTFKSRLDGSRALHDHPLPMTPHQPPAPPPLPPHTVPPLISPMTPRLPLLRSLADIGRPSARSRRLSHPPLVRTLPPHAARNANLASSRVSRVSRTSAPSIRHMSLASITRRSFRASTHRSGSMSRGTSQYSTTSAYSSPPLSPVFPQPPRFLPTDKPKSIDARLSKLMKIDTSAPWNRGDGGVVSPVTPTAKKMTNLEALRQRMGLERPAVSPVTPTERRLTWGGGEGEDGLWCVFSEDEAEGSRI